MHEQSLVKNLLRQVDEIRCQHDAACVSEVRVELGPMSGVEPLLLANAFELLKSDTSAASARLVIEEVPLLAECRSCNDQFEITDFVFRCPHCAGNVKVVQGDLFHLVSISFPELVDEGDNVVDSRPSIQQEIQ